MKENRDRFKKGTYASRLPFSTPPEISHNELKSLDTTEITNAILYPNNPDHTRFDKRIRI